MENELYSFDIVGDIKVVVEALDDGYEGIAFKNNPSNPFIVVRESSGEQARISVLNLWVSDERRT